MATSDVTRFFGAEDRAEIKKAVGEAERRTSGEIVLYNILGQEVSRTQAGNGLNVIPVAQGDAVYIVKVISDNVNVTKKVFVK